MAVEANQSWRSASGTRPRRSSARSTRFGAAFAQQIDGGTKLFAGALPQRDRKGALRPNVLFNKVERHLVRGRSRISRSQGPDVTACRPEFSAHAPDASTQHPSQPRGVSGLRSYLAGKLGLACQIHIPVLRPRNISLRDDRSCTTSSLVPTRCSKRKRPPVSRGPKSNLIKRSRRDSNPEPPDP